MKRVQPVPRTKPMHAETACIITYESIAANINEGLINVLINKMNFHRTKKNSETISTDDLLYGLCLNSNDLLALENQNAIYDTRIDSFRLYNLISDELFDEWTYSMSLKQKYNFEGVLSLYGDPISFDDVFLWRDHHIISPEHQVLYNFEYIIQYIDSARLTAMDNAVMRATLLKQIRDLCNNMSITDLTTVLTDCKTLALLKGDNIDE